jgi:hypothetical protein
MFQVKELTSQDKGLLTILYSNLSGEPMRMKFGYGAMMYIKISLINTPLLISMQIQKINPYDWYGAFSSAIGFADM